MTSTDFRSRLYETYVQARSSIDPGTLAGLRGRLPYLRRVVRNHFPENRNATILDLGCGHGALLHAARLEGYTALEGVDLSAEQVQLAERLGIPGVREGDVMQVLAELPDGSRDVIVTFDVIEHLRRDELFALTDEVHRVLASGGGWIIHAPNGESPMFGRVRYGDLTHEQAFTRESVQQFLRPAGFVHIATFEDVPVVHGLRSAIRSVLWRGIRGLMRVYLAAETGQTGRDAIFSQNFLVVARKG